MNNYVRFNWAIGRFLSDKVNYDVLEWRFSTLLEMKLK